MRAALLLAIKDARTIVRTRTLFVILVAYPIMMAALIGALLLASSGKPRIAIVNKDKTGKVLKIGGSRFGIDEYRRQAATAGVDLVDMDEKEAMRSLDEGQVSGVLVIPAGFMAKLRTQLAPSKIEFHTGESALGDAVTQRVRGVVYRINLKISRALVKSNAEYLRTLVTGGDVVVMGRDYSLLGLDPASQMLEQVREETSDEDAADDIQEVIDFAADAGTALELADNALEATAAPVRLEHVRTDGKSPRLTARAMSFALAVSLAFIATVLAAASVAAEGDERVLGRLLHSSITSGQVLVSKLIVGAALSSIFCFGLFAVFAVLAPQAWTRLPLLLLMAILSAAAFSSLGALIAGIARDARTATLGAILIVLPMVPLGMLPSDGGFSFAASWFLPFEASQSVFNIALFDLKTSKSLMTPVLTLIAMTLGYGLVASRLIRRL